MRPENVLLAPRAPVQLSSLPSSPSSSPSSCLTSFAPEIVRWQATHGRHSLPWQNTRDPYRVWLSEIMLQQTQVSTVLDYYARFLARFPGVADLAAATPDEVMALWSGLGYYSRARNLHRCAQDVMALHGGQFPRSAEQLQTLPGIGRSTAAAIASFCFGERVAILDANVKRVLTRVLGFSADLAQASSERALWAEATALLPQRNLAQAMPRYTQGLMDLGATLCAPRQPQCLMCPVQSMCQARAQGAPEKYPVKTRSLKRSAQALSLLWAERPDGAVWLERRPETGVWGGLYCLPVFDSEAALREFLPPRLQAQLLALPSFVHVLTHKDLQLAPWQLRLLARQALPQGQRVGGWFAPGDWVDVGLPAPVRKLLLSPRPAPGAA